MYNIVIDMKITTIPPHLMDQHEMRRVITFREKYLFPISFIMVLNKLQCVTTKCTNPPPVLSQRHIILII